MQHNITFNEWEKHVICGVYTCKICKLSIKDFPLVQISAFIESLQADLEEFNKGRWYAAEDIDRMVKELDVCMYGDDAAQQAMLCDIVDDLKTRLKKTANVAYAVKMENGYWVGIWNNKETAAKVLDKSITYDEIIEVWYE